MQYRKVAVSEQELEDLVRKNTGQIEEGLIYLDHQKQAAGGRLDVLMVDSGDALVVAELKVTPDEGILIQALDYYDDVVEHIETYARLYHEDHKINPTQDVRLFLIAPSYSQSLLKRCKWLNLPISLFTFSCVKSDQNHSEIVPSFSEQSFPTLKEPPPEKVDHLAYITDPSVRSMADDLLKEIANSYEGHITLDSISWGISMKVDNQVFAYLITRRKHFLIQTYDAEDERIDCPIHGADDLDKVKGLLKAAIERKKR